AGGLERLGPLPDREEDLLGDVLGRVPVADNAHGQAEDVRPELVVEVGQRTRVTRDQAVPDRQLPCAARSVDHSHDSSSLPGRRISVWLVCPAGSQVTRGVTSVSDLFSIEGKAALVTGGSRGIGLMIARGFVEAGARVYISSRKKEVCDEVAGELSKVGTCVSLPADLATEDACIGLAAEVSAQEPALHIL